MTSQIISIFFLIADPAAPANFAEFMRWEAAAFGFGRGKKLTTFLNQNMEMTLSLREESDSAKFCDPVCFTLKFFSLVHGHSVSMDTWNKPC